MKKMRYLFMTLAIVGIFAVSIQSNVYAADREAPILPAISAALFECTYAPLTVPAGAGNVASGTIVTINNGAIARNVIVQFSAEAMVNSASMYIHYSIDGGLPINIGAEYFATNTTYENRSHMGVINLPAGVHTIEPHFVFNGVAPDNGYVYYRCLTAEGRTK